MSRRKDAIAWRVDFRYTDRVRREGRRVAGLVPVLAQRVHRITGILKSGRCSLDVRRRALPRLQAHFCAWTDLR